MRLSKIIEAVREVLQAPDSTHWDDKQIVQHINRHIASLARRMAEVDEGYLNASLVLPKTAARKVKADVWDYTLPPWVERITEVRRSGSPTDPTGVARDAVVPVVGKLGSNGWTTQGRSLRLVTSLDPIDLEVGVAKTPAALTKGTLPTPAQLPASPAGAYLRLDADTSADALVYPHETLADSYINAIVEITGQNARSGQLRTVIGSTHFQNEAGTLYTVLQLDSAWTVAPQAGDTYELRSEIPEQHMQLVVLLTAHSLWATRGQYEQQKAVTQLLSEEMSAFMRHITPRQVQQPYYLRHTILPPASTLMRGEDSYNTLWK